jgi:uncharacterized membrane protein
MNDNFSENLSKSWKDLDPNEVELPPETISRKRKAGGIFLALLGITFFVLSSIFRVVTHTSQVPQSNGALIWLGIAFLYCGALAGMVRTNGGGSRIALGCYGALLFGIAFITAFMQMVW